MLKNVLTPPTLLEMAMLQQLSEVTADWEKPQAAGIASELTTTRPESSDSLHTDEWRIRVATCTVCPLHIQVRVLIWREIVFYLLVRRGFFK